MLQGALLVALEEIWFLGGREYGPGKQSSMQLCSNFQCQCVALFTFYIVVCVK